MPLTVRTLKLLLVVLMLLATVRVHDRNNNSSNGGETGLFLFAAALLQGRFKAVRGWIQLSGADGHGE